MTSAGFFSIEWYLWYIQIWNQLLRLLDPSETAFSRVVLKALMNYDASKAVCYSLIQAWMPVVFYSSWNIWIAKWNAFLKRCKVWGITFDVCPPTQNWETCPPYPRDWSCWPSTYATCLQIWIKSLRELYAPVH